MTQPQYNVVRLAEGRRDEILAERAEAARLREQKLAPLGFDQPLIVDLSGLRIITFSAADELLAPWLVLARNKQRDRAVVVGFYSPLAVVQETLDAVLRAQHLAAYGFRRSRNPADEIPEFLGEVTRTNEETVRAVQARSEGISATGLAKQLGLADTAAIARLQEVVTKGLVQRGAKAARPRGRPSALYFYPFSSIRQASGRASASVRPLPA